MESNKQDYLGMAGGELSAGIKEQNIFQISFDISQLPFLKISE